MGLGNGIIDFLSLSLGNAFLISDHKTHTERERHTHTHEEEEGRGREGKKHHKEVATKAW